MILGAMLKHVCRQVGGMANSPDSMQRIWRYILGERGALTLCTAQAGAASMEAWLPSSAQSVLEALLMDPADLAGRMQRLQSGTSDGAGSVSRPESKEEATREHPALIRSSQQYRRACLQAWGSRSIE